MTQLPNNHYAVTVEAGCFGYHYEPKDERVFIECTSVGSYSIPLPPGSYTIVGLGSELGEETYFEIFGINDMQADYNLQPETTLIIKKNE